MRKVLVVVLLLAGLAIAGGISVDTTHRYEFTNCPVEGSTAQTVPEGTYLLRIADEAVNVCLADPGQTDGGKGAGCQTPDGGTVQTGEKFPTGMAMIFSVPRAGYSVTCRSAGATGDLILTAATQ